jgi:hypothetical protein
MYREHILSRVSCIAYVQDVLYLWRIFCHMFSIACCCISGMTLVYARHKQFFVDLLSATYAPRAYFVA